MMMGLLKPIRRRKNRRRDNFKGYLKGWYSKA